MPSYSGRVLKGGWRLKNQLGAGACAAIYDVDEEKPGSNGSRMRWVAKVCPLPPQLPPSKKRRKTDDEKNADLLYYEFTLYNGHLRGHPSVPVVPFGRGYGDDAGDGRYAEPVRFLILQRLGLDLQHALEANGGPIGLQEAASLALGMLEALRVLHEAHRLVFVDVKPQNFLLAPEDDASSNEPSQEISGVPVTKVFLVDFGLCERYVAAVGGGHRPFRQLSTISGTPEFLSLSCHQGGLAGRSDDLEAVGYVLWHLLAGGRLPWSDAASNADGASRKRSAAIDSAPAPEVAEWIALARATGYEERPDYDKFEALLVKMWRRGASSGGQKAPGGNKSGAQRRALGALQAGGKGSGKAASAAGGSKKDKVTGGKGPEMAEAGECPQRVEPNKVRRTVTDPSPAIRKENAAPAGVGGGGGGGPAKRRVRAPAVAPAASVKIEDPDTVSESDEEEEESDMEMAIAASLELAAKISNGAATKSSARIKEQPEGPQAAHLKVEEHEQQPPTDFVLSVTKGPHCGAVYEVISGEEPLLAGRGKGRKFGLSLHKDGEVSERHFKARVVVLPTAGGGVALEVTDLNSTNGTFLDGQRLQSGVPAYVADGGVIGVGRSSLAVHQLTA